VVERVFNIRRGKGNERKGEARRRGETEQELEVDGLDKPSLVFKCSSLRYRKRAACSGSLLP
jgi:hypothetical protein